MRRSVAVFVLGVLVGSLLVATQARSVGGVEGLLQVGAQSNLRTTIEAELGDVPLSSTGGHDGQISYAIGLDLIGDTVPPLLDDAGYRYRRFLYPAAASLLGLLDGHALLWSMVVWAVLGFGVAVAAVDAIAQTLGAHRLAVLGVVANPGAWLGVRLLTPDALGLGLALCGVALALRRRTAPAAALLAAAALAKDQFLLVAASVALIEVVRRRPVAALASAGIPTLALGAWATWLSTTVGGGFDPRGNLGPPFAGILDAASGWSALPLERGYAVTMLVILGVTAVVLVVRTPFELGVLAWPWIALAVLSSTWVWDFGNNAVRAFAIVGAFLGLAIASTKETQRT